MTDTSEDSTALVAPSPSGPAPLVISSSLESSVPGELLLVGASGQVMTRRERIYYQLKRSMLLGAVAGMLAAYGSTITHSLFGALVAPVMFLLLISFRLRNGARIRGVAALLGAQRDAEAMAEIDALSRQRLDGRERIALDHMRGHVAWRLGRRQEALAAFTKVAERTGARGQAWSRTIHYLCQFQRAQLLCIEGRVDEARAIEPDLDRAPAGDYFRLQRHYVRLQIAFASHTSGGMPGDLYDWARSILKTNRFGSGAVLLAWAFADRGDEEMADHMLREAVPRLRDERMAVMMPELSAWFLEACARRGVNPEGAEASDASDRSG